LTLAITLQVSVMDANGISRNTLIGLYEFDLLGVYYGTNHEVPLHPAHMQWRRRAADA
jgi:hypothetical protein